MGGELAPHPLRPTEDTAKIDIGVLHDDVTLDQVQPVIVMRSVEIPTPTASTEELRLPGGHMPGVQIAHGIGEIHRPPGKVITVALLGR